MADIKVELNGDDVNRAIADAIVKSVLGDTIVKMVNDYVKQISSSYDNPVRKVVEAEVKAQVQALVLQNLPTIQEAVRTQLADGVVDKITTAAIEKLLKGIY